MTWRIAITHTSGYKYRRDGRVVVQRGPYHADLSHRQLVMESEVAVTPSAVAFRYWDYWGTLVHAFDIHVPHVELSVTGTSVVETSPRPGPPDEVATWSDLARPDLRDRFAELLAPTRHVPLDDELRAAAEPFRRESTPAAACEAAVAWVKGSLRYQKGTTDVSTPAPDVLRQGSGVCQDFAHVTLALLRSVGIPARYVSGYLHPTADAEWAWPWWGRATPGSRRGPATGRPSTPPTGWWPSATWWWGGPATTPTCRPSTASTTAGRPRPWA